jgi:hypothetical protein
MKMVQKGRLVNDSSRWVEHAEHESHLGSVDLDELLRDWRMIREP